MDDIMVIIGGVYGRNKMEMRTAKLMRILQC